MTLLLEMDADIDDKKSKYGQTAVLNGNITILRALLATGNEIDENIVLYASDLNVKEIHK